MDVIDGVRAAIKEMMIPELDRIREENKEIKATLVMINKRLDDANLHLADQSRRIDALREELSRRIETIREELSSRIESVRDELSKRIDNVQEQLSQRIDNVREELSRRIDETNKRIDATNIRIDDTNSRINDNNICINDTNKRIDAMAQKFDIRLDRLYEVIVRRDEHQLAEQRIAALERDVAEIKLRLAA